MTYPPLHELTSIHIQGIDRNDHPKYSDAYLDSAIHNGRKLSREECNEITKNEPEWINQLANEITLTPNY